MDELDDVPSVKALWVMLLAIILCLALVYAVSAHLENECIARGGHPESRMITGTTATIVCVEEMENDDER